MMSWHFTVQDVPREQLESQLQAAAEKNFQGMSEVLPESRSDANLSIRAALSLLSGVGTDGNISASLSGHSNPDHHGKVEGYSNEVINVSVSEV